MAGKKNNNAIIGSVVAVVIILAAAGYFFTKDSGAPAVEGQIENTANVDMDSPEVADAATEEEGSDPAEVETAAGNATAVVNPMNPDGDTELVVEPGNPVVAVVDGKEITRVDVYRFIQTMPAQMQQLPASAIYPMAMEQVINTRIVQNKADSADITDSEEFKHEMDIAKQQIARNIYLQKEVDSKISEGKIKKAYDEYVKKIPAVEERRASHILVETEDKAKEVIEKLNAGEKFEDLAKSLSVGPSAPNGGDLGYFAKTDMVPEFSNVAFGMSEGDVVDAPVKTQFGWHVIKLVDVRERAKPTLEQMKPMIQAELRREVLDELLSEWREDVKVEKFDINGKPLKKGADASGLVPPKAENQGG